MIRVHISESQASLNIFVSESAPSINVELPQYVTFASTATSASYAGTASFALALLGAIESASYAASVPWNGIFNIPSGIVSNSTQINYTEIQNRPNIIPTASSVAWVGIIGVPNNLVSSSTQVDYTSLHNIPSSIISSSTQAATWTVASASAAASSSTAIIATRAITASIADTASIVAFSNITNLPSLVSASSQILYNGIGGVPVGIVSSSAQAATWFVASSSTALLAQQAITASRSITASFADTVIFTNIAERPTLVSGSSQIIFNGISGIPLGLVSSSTQITSVMSASFAATAALALNTPVLPTGLVSSSAQVSFTGLINVPPGLVSSSAQISQVTTASLALQSQQAVSASFATQALTAVSASWAPSTGGQVTDWSSIINRPVGLVSSSVQAASWSVATASIANAVQFVNILNRPSLVSSSIQIDVRNTTGIGTIATTGSNTFNGTQTISGSLFSTADIMTFIGAFGVSGSMSVSGAMTVLSIISGTIISALTASRAALIDGGTY